MIGGYYVYVVIAPTFLNYYSIHISAMAYIAKWCIILIMTNAKTFRYKGMRVNAFGLPIFSSSKKENKKFYKKIRKRSLYHVSFLSSFREDAPKNLIIMYDVPHNMKKERDWFRRHLIKFGYVMIQKSIWVGPSPLPKDFLIYLKEIKIGDKFKTFKLAKSYDSSISAMA